MASRSLSSILIDISNQRSFCYTSFTHKKYKLNSQQNFIDDWRSTSHNQLSYEIPIYIKHIFSFMICMPFLQIQAVCSWNGSARYISAWNWVGKKAHIHKRTYASGSLIDYPTTGSPMYSNLRYFVDSPRCGTTLDYCRINLFFLLSYLSVLECFLVDIIFANICIFMIHPWTN